MLPDFVITRHDGINVLRDDLIPGGTKQRVLEPWLKEMGPGEYVYASPAEGYAQIALALACKALGKKWRANIFVARRKAQHDRTLEAQRQGATITLVDNVAGFNVLTARAREYANYPVTPVKGALKRVLLPFGLDHERFRELMVETVKDNWKRQGYKAPKEVWAVVGSGTLIRCLQEVWPKADFHAVQVGHNADVGKATKHIYPDAPKSFSKKAKIMPPFPSCDTYDAKGWEFVQKYASRGALFWNVAADPEDALDKIARGMNKTREQAIKTLSKKVKGAR